MKKKFVDTKIGSFLKEKAPHVIDKIAEVAGKSGIPIVSQIGNVVDMLIPEMKEEIQPLLDDYDKELPLLLADLADARNREIAIATSEHAPLLNKIITPLLALLILGSCFLLWYMVLFKDISPQKETIMAGIIGSLTTLSMGVVGYYFGSSQGSRDKSETLKKIINQ